MGSCEYHFVVVLHVDSYLMRPFYHVLTNKILSSTLVLVLFGHCFIFNCFSYAFTETINNSLSLDICQAKYHICQTIIRSILCMAWSMTENYNCLCLYKFAITSICGTVFFSADCFNGRGRGYSGTISTTRSGKTCQNWDVQIPHRFTLPSSQYPELGDHNYCRNPGSRGPDGPWCFTTDPDTRWEYCNVSKCGKYILVILLRSSVC